LAGVEMSLGMPDAYRLGLAIGGGATAITAMMVGFLALQLAEYPLHMDIDCGRPATGKKNKNSRHTLSATGVVASPLLNDHFAFLEARAAAPGLAPEKCERVLELQ